MSSETGLSSLEQFEAFGPGGVAIMIDAATNDRARTGAELREVLQRFGGDLDQSGSMGWLFNRKGLISVRRAADDDSAFERLTEAATEVGAEDVLREGEVYLVETAPPDFEKIRSALEAKQFEVEHAELAAVPKNFTHVEGEHAKKMLDLIKALEDHVEVRRVFVNFDIDSHLMEQISA